MSQTYLCKNLGVEGGGGCSFEGDLLTGDYGTGRSSTASNTINYRKLKQHRLTPGQGGMCDHDDL